MNVVSIREEPAKLMRKLVPPDVDILATLPLFGPQSAAARLSLLVQSPVPKWRRAGLRVMCMSPKSMTGKLRSDKLAFPFWDRPCGTLNCQDLSPCKVSTC